MDANRFALLLKDAKVIEADGLGIKVAALADGRFLKLFRRRRLLSTALWAPPCRRFARNAARLERLQIIAPKVLESIRVPEQGLGGVLYWPLPGETLRQRWAELDEQTLMNEVRQFGGFLGELHEKGVYFRSLHLANVLRLPDGQLGLLDVADMRIRRRPLNDNLRARNLRHMLRYRQDQELLAKHYPQQWLDNYGQVCGEGRAALLGQALQQAASH